MNNFLSTIQPIQPLLGTGSGTPQTQSQSSVPLAETIGNAIGIKAGTAIGGTSTGGIDFGLSGGNILSSRVVAILLGLICVAGGIFLFKPVQGTVIETIKTATKTAAVAA